MTQHKKHVRIATVLVIVCAILFWLSFAIASSGQITGVEKSVFDWIYGWPNVLEPLFIGITFLGSVYALPILLVVLVLLKQKLTAARVLLLAASTYVVIAIAKHVVERSRPNELLSGVVQRGPTEADYGFPSGHSGLAMAMAFGLLTITPKKYWWMYGLLVILIGISRIYLGVHAPLDVLGGFAIGLGIGAVYYLASGPLERKIRARKSLAQRASKPSDKHS